VSNFFYLLLFYWVTSISCSFEAISANVKIIDATNATVLIMSSSFTNGTTKGLCKPVFLFSLFNLLNRKVFLTHPSCHLAFKYSNVEVITTTFFNCTSNTTEVIFLEGCRAYFAFNTFFMSKPKLSLPLTENIFFITIALNQTHSTDRSRCLLSAAVQRSLPTSLLIKSNSLKPESAPFYLMSIW